LVGKVKLLREERSLRVFENRALRRTLGPKREEVAGGWRRLHNEELHNFIRRIGHVALVGEMRNAYNILVEMPERKRPIGRPRHRWEDNIRMDLREMRWENVVQDRFHWRAF
jgi:hypothetical protein